METSALDTIHNADISKSVTKHDEIILLDIFPEEVWLAVFKEVKSSQDLIQISNSSLFFRNLLLSQRTLFLFSKVWQILGMVYETSDDLVYMEHKENHVQTLINSNNISYYKTKWFSGILKYRQVCKLWCSTVDNFYKNYPNIYGMEQDVKSDLTRDVWGCGAQNGEWTRKYYFWSSADVVKFQSHFSDTHKATDRNPFLANFVSLNVNLDSAEVQKEIFEIYGKHVWHCHLGIQDDTAELYSKLIDLLKLMPSLRSLRILYSLRNPNNVADLKLAICANPLPTCRNLKFLKVDNVPGPLFDNLLEMNSHVEMIEVSREDRNVQNMYPIFTRELCNLSQISLEIHSRHYLEQLKNCPFEWKFEKIYLNFSKCSYIPWSEIFKVLVSKWAKTVTNVALHLPKAITPAEKDNHISDLSSLQLQLTNLKRLKIVLENASSIDFVLSMKNTLTQSVITETVSLIKEMDAWKKIGFQEIIENQIIDYNVFQKTFYLSNIWTMLPALQRLGYENMSGKMECKFYKRVEWIQKMQKYC